METNGSKIAGLRTSAIVEIALFLLVMLGLDMVLFDGTRYFTANPHPFWIIVLLVACQYGTAEGLLAAIAASVALLLFNLPPQTLGQDGYAYLFYVIKTPLLWVIAAVVLGELRLRHVRERANLKRELAAAHEREEGITRNYQATREIKEKMELRIAGQLRSSISAYRAARSMESLSPEQVYRGLEELISALLGPEKFSLHGMNEGGFTLALSHGWQESDGYSRTINDRTELFRAVAGARQSLVISNPQHEAILGGQGVIAGPLLDRATGEVFGMLKIEKLSFSDLNLSTIETFNAICEWAGTALANAQYYQLAKDSSMVNPDHNLLSTGYFTRHLEYVAALGRRVGFDVSMIVVRVSNMDAMNLEARQSVARALSHAVDSVLRAVDLAFDYQGTSGEYSIVLPATSAKGAEIVVAKIRNEMNSKLEGAARSAQIAFSVQNVHQQAA